MISSRCSSGKNGRRRAKNGACSYNVLRSRTAPSVRSKAFPRPSSGAIESGDTVTVAVNEAQPSPRWRLWLARMTRSSGPHRALPGLRRAAGGCRRPGRSGRLGRPASCQIADTSGNLGQIIVELVIAAAEPMNDRAGYRSLIKIDMRKRRSVVLAAVIEIDRRLLRQSRAEVCRWFDVFTRPAARTKKRARDKKYAGKPSVRRRFRDGVDQNRAANRVAYQYRAIIEAGELFRERRLPHGIAGIRLVRHARVPDIVVGPKFVPQAVDELVVPFIMSPL